MSDGVFISDRPQLAIARQTVSFASLGLNDPTLTRIIYEVGNPYLSYVPTDEFNPISGITEGKSYLLYLNAFFDGSPALANAVLTNLIPQTTTNVFADERVVFLCTSSVSFATAGITTSNTRLITLVSEGYFTSYDPNDSINGIDGFVEGELYDIDPITDIDLHLYGVTKIRYSDEVLYLDSLEDVVVTNSLPDATLPLVEDEVLVRNLTTGVWENKPVSDLPTGSGYTDEQAQDAVGTILSSEFTYDDATPQISINSIPYSKITGTPSIPTQYTDEQAQDATAALFAAGTHTGITFTYDDAGNKISAVVTATGTTPGIDDVLAVGQALTANRTINAGTNKLTSTSTFSDGGSNSAFNFDNTLNTSSLTVGLKATATGTNSSSAAIVAAGSGVVQGLQASSSTGNGINASSTSGNAIKARSTSGAGASIQSDTGIPIDAANFSSSGTGGITTLLRLTRDKSGSAANGIGGAIDFYHKSSDTFAYVSARVMSYWKDITTASRKGVLSNAVVYNNTTVTTDETCSGYLQTNNATPAVMATTPIDDETCGIIEVYIVARHSTTSGMVVGKKIFSYIKDGGILTLGTQTTVLADEITGSCVGSSYSISVVSNQLSISVTGVAATTINWKATIKIIPNS
jgi:hypothetical protein